MYKGLKGASRVHSVFVVVLVSIIPTKRMHESLTEVQGPGGIFNKETIKLVGFHVKLANSWSHEDEIVLNLNLWCKSNKLSVMVCCLCLDCRTIHLVSVYLWTCDEILGSFKVILMKMLSLEWINKWIFCYFSDDLSSLLRYVWWFLGGSCMLLTYHQKRIAMPCKFSRLCILLRAVCVCEIKSRAF